jgi:hypothetical protein
MMVMDADIVWQERFETRGEAEGGQGLEITIMA